ncbi:uncharacterized protein A4U43_C07F9710 [Asparagus officinalis]|uniref:TCTP domain-containing protein n=1 Tax=Asparagus officinalis TaxID=4686 RepID=A0A5P1EDZ6_ASPOF|nr:uncharacterized protein A4U43_C07F9710 [Asparagus officinalis]
MSSNRAMVIMLDLALCDELLSDSFPCKEVESGVLLEVEGKWVVQGAIDVNISANPSAEDGDGDEGAGDQAVKVLDIVDAFRLQLLTPKLEADKQEAFKKNIEGATKFLLSKLKDLQLFVGESMHDDSSIVFAYYRDGATDLTFLYLAYGLKEAKC